MAVDYARFAQNSGIDMNKIMNAANMGLKIRQIRQQNAAAEAQRARGEAYQTAVKEFDEGPQDAGSYAKLARDFPEYAKGMKDAYDIQSGERKTTIRKNALELHNALSSGNVNVAIDLLNTRIEAAENSGDKGKVQILSSMRDKLDRSDPQESLAGAKELMGQTSRTLGIILNPEEAGKQLLGIRGAGRAPTAFEEFTSDPEGYKKYKNAETKAGRAPTSFEEYMSNKKDYEEYKALARKDGRTPTSFEEYLSNPVEYTDFKDLDKKEDKSFVPLTEERKKELGIKYDGSLQIEEKSGQISTIGGAGTTVNIGAQPPPTVPGYVTKKTEDGGWVMEVIPNGPVDRAIKEEEKKQIGQAQEKTQYAEVVFEDIGRLKKKIKEATWLNPVTGIWAEVMAKIPGSNRTDADRLATGIVANIGFDRLFQMRQNNPTGGALGNISNQEIDFLQSIMGSIARSQSDEQLLENLDRLETVYRGFISKHGAFLKEKGYLKKGGSIVLPDSIVSGKTSTQTTNPNVNKFLE